MAWHKTLAVTALLASFLAEASGFSPSDLGSCGTLPVHLRYLHFLRGRGSSQHSCLGRLTSCREAQESLGPLADAETPKRSFQERAQLLFKKRRQVNYFAYGANLSPDVLTGRRGVKPIESRAGFVDGYSLRFCAGSFPFVGPAYASAEPGGDFGLHGVVFTISRADWAKVQATEGAGVAYALEPVTVQTYDGEYIESLTLRSMAPFRVPDSVQGTTSRPSGRYMDLIEKGAVDYGLDEGYRERLSKVKRFPFG